jgi:prepilin-type N-terminal cleavage/methylation domain-containing protein
LTIGSHSTYHGIKGGFLFENIQEKENFRMRRTRTAEGFSLIELIIAVGLVAIVSAIAVPQFQRYSANTDLKAAAREVSGDISNTKQAAVGENVNAYRLSFNVAGNNYSLSRTDTGVTLWTKSFASFGSGIRIESVNFGGGSVIAFDKRGTTTSTLGSVRLINKILTKAKVTVNITGKTYVQCPFIE